MEAEVIYLRKRDVETVLIGVTEYYSANDCQNCAKFLNALLVDNLPNPNDYTNALCIQTEGKIVGCVFYTISFADDNICEASYLWINAKYRHNGLATMLMNTLINELKLLDESIKPVMLMVSLSEKGLKEYKKLGFKKICKIPFTDHFIASIKI